MLTPLVVITLFAVVMCGMAFEMWRVPAGIQRERAIEGRKISSRTRALTTASPDDALRLLQTDWSWWHRARAEPMQELDGGLKAFRFHPIRMLNILEVPPAFVVRFERIERYADGGFCIHATLTGDFNGGAEYSARPTSNGTMIELAWVRAEVRGVLRLLTTPGLAATHCWRERIGVQGLRARLDRGV